MENIVCTMPIKPKKETNLVMKIDPIVTEFIGDALKYKKILTANIMNSYDDKTNQIESYIKELEQDGIYMDKIYKDKDYLDEILEKIEVLIHEKIIIEAKEPLYRCNCGKVDLLKKSIEHYSDGDIYKIENGKMYCKHCGSECKESMENILVVNVEKDKISPIKIVPNYMNKVTNGIINEMAGSFILISKLRDTGCSILLNGIKYNIDADFIWSLLLQNIEADKRILVAGNRQIAKMFNLNYINGLYDKHDIYFVAHPFLEINPEEINKCHFNEDNDPLIQKITVLCNLKWKNNNSKFTYSIYKYIRNLSIEERHKFYIQMINCFENDDMLLEDLIEKGLLDSSNFQKNVSLIKKK